MNQLRWKGWVAVRGGWRTIDSEHDVSRMRVRMDTLTRQERSERMSRIRSRDTGPEIRVRRTAHSLGYRFRLHRRDLPGAPDLTFASRRLALFVHGCFWHRHPDCPLARLPKSRLEFWQPKLEGNRARDLANQRRLDQLGWSTAVLWECETLIHQTLVQKLEVVLGTA